MTVTINDGPPLWVVIVFIVCAAIWVFLPKD